MGRKKNRRTIAEAVDPTLLLNDQQQLHYLRMLKSLALSVFKWGGLPVEIDQRFLELCLYEKALAVFFYDNTQYNAYFALRGTPAGKMNMYDNPTKFLATGANGFRRECLAAFGERSGKTAMSGYGVPIWGNMLRQPMFPSLTLFARRLADIDRTIEVNLANQKRPYIIECEESQKLSVANMFKQVQDNEPFILVNKGLTATTQPANAILLNPQYIADKLLIDKAKIWNEAMTFLGIDNANQDKRERLVAEEVSANNGQIEVARLTALNTRRAACEEINRRYGLNVSVNYNHDLESANEQFANDDAAQAALAAEVLTVSISPDAGGES